MSLDQKLVLPAQKVQQLESQIASLVSRIEWLERVLSDNHVQRTLMIEQKFGKPVSAAVLDSGQDVPSRRQQ